MRYSFTNYNNINSLHFKSKKFKKMLDIMLRLSYLWIVWGREEVNQEL